MILPLCNAPAEFAFVRKGDRVLVDCYGTESAPEIFLREREIAIADLLAACSEGGRRLAQASRDATSRAAMLQLSRRAADAPLRAEAPAQPRALRCSGGSLESPGKNVPLAFGFEAEIVPIPRSERRVARVRRRARAAVSRLRSGHSPATSGCTCSTGR